MKKTERVFVTSAWMATINQKPVTRIVESKGKARVRKGVKK